jgi:hypothetical protein
MGWQDRDDAKLRDDELAALYNVRRPTPTRSVPVRPLVWSAVGIATLVVFGFAMTQRPSAGPVPLDLPTTIVGTALPDDYITGPDNVCTEFQFVAGRGWDCLVSEVNFRHLRVVPATPYNGNCSHLEVEGEAWACLNAGLPEPATAPQPAGANS